jgi:hypothetical protein
MLDPVWKSRQAEKSLDYDRSFRHCVVTCMDNVERRKINLGYSEYHG